MIASDARILWSLLRGHPRSGDHAADLTEFYAAQAEDYDTFRQRLLPGRAELYTALARHLPEKARLVELGAGTGQNLGWLGDSLTRLERADLVDLCPPLLERARQRWHGSAIVHCHLADACHWQPEQAADVVVFSYALTMVPDWRGALANALSMLKPGGMLAVVDFTLLPEQTRLSRAFWRRWFAHDGVRLSTSHLPALRAALPIHQWCFGRAKLPYLPGLQPVYYAFLGQKA